jgi:hypothetical protein
VADAISDTCQNLEEVTGMLMMKIDNEKNKLIGQIKFAGNSVTEAYFRFTQKKLNFDYSGITSSEAAWKEGPAELHSPVLVLPIDPCLTLKKLVLMGGKLDVVELLQLLPNLEDLHLTRVNLTAEKKQRDATQILGSKLKSLNLSCDLVASGVIDLLNKSKSLKNVTLQITGIPEFKVLELHFDTLLRKFPFMEKLMIFGASAQLTMTDPAENAIADHPLKELSFIRYKTEADLDAHCLRLENIDFNRYKQLQILHLKEVHLGPNVKLNSRLKVLEVDSIRGLHKETFNIPDTLYHLKWESTFMHSEILEAMKKMKKLGSVQFSGQLLSRAMDLYGERKIFLFILRIRLTKILNCQIFVTKVSRA